MSAQPQVASSGSPLKLNPQGVVCIQTSGSNPLTTSLFRLSSSPEPTSTSTDDPQPQKAQKRNIGNITSHRTKKPIAGDFVDEVESTILLAAHYYCVLLCTEHAFPLELDSNLYAKQAWQLACQEHENHTLATPDFYQVVCLLNSHKRTHYVAHTLPSFVSMQAKSGVSSNMPYDPLSPHITISKQLDPADTANTMTLISCLKANNTLVYKDHETRMRLFETPILLNAIKTQWFSHAHAEGVNFHMYFNPILMPVMALVFSMIENCLDEWKSGHFKPIPFREKCYQEIFKEHLATLDKWQNHPQGGSILAWLQTHLHDKAQYRCYFTCSLGILI
ncbi:hypothetical protein K439DRAFT_1619904 [Ramaria rubella]|nr:hypothetical protein K439DRAFT_1619904 [Ramaria rubella]